MPPVNQNLDTSPYQDLTPNRPQEIVTLRCDTSPTGYAEHTLIYSENSDQWLLKHVCNRQGGTVINGAAFTWANFVTRKPITITGLVCTQCGIKGHVTAYVWADDPGSTGVDGHDNYSLRK